MIKKIANILGWVTGTGIVLAGIIIGGAKYIAWEQIKEDRATKADSLMIQEFRLVKVNVDTLIVKIESIEVKQNDQISGLRAIDRSYSKHLKDKDELIEYLQMQNEGLKKK
jgi:hypothetical protein